MPCGRAVGSGAVENRTHQTVRAIFQLPQHRSSSPHLFPGTLRRIIMNKSYLAESTPASHSANASDAVTPANPQMNDVQALFKAFPAKVARQYYECKELPTGPFGMIASHFKGVAAFGGKLIFSHTDLDLLPPALNGKYLTGDIIRSGDQGEIDHVGDTAHPGWCHPCGIQACGSFLAMGIQKSATGTGVQSAIEIYDMRNALLGQPIVLLGTITRFTDGINGVAMTKQAGPDGKYIVAGVNGSSLTVYTSTTSSLLPFGDTRFVEVLQANDFPASGAGLALITQADGAIFLISMNADDDGAHSQIALYALDLDCATPTCTELAEKAMPVPGMSESLTILESYIATIDPPWGPILSQLLAFGNPVLNSSFRWGRGLSITSPDSIEIYATDRNVLPLSHIPQIDSQKDFSVVVWSSAPA
ncbi:hypothetical protein [Massilia antarctica]|uniref:hypothetical protein n=1 Tax=Massilia antarctica TaxID=2765360 RepID=UPI0011AEFAE4|nr:hypothetical protein [Massilia sp. H27-R4]MCY0914189.1 hypothetical protein [Massilia sp. H27-R4]